MNQIDTPLPALSPQGGKRVAEGRERGWFMGRLSNCRLNIGDTAGWQPAVSPMFNRQFDSLPMNQPLSRPSATLFPPCGERAGRGVSIWFMVSTHVQSLEVSASHEPPIGARTAM